MQRCWAAGQTVLRAPGRASLTVQNCPHSVQVGVVRAHSSFLAAHRIGPVTCLAFAPYELLLASGALLPNVYVDLLLASVAAADPSHQAAASAHSLLLLSTCVYPARAAPTQWWQSLQPAPASYQALNHSPDCHLPCSPQAALIQWLPSTAWSRRQRVRCRPPRRGGRPLAPAPPTRCRCRHPWPARKCCEEARTAASQGLALRRTAGGLSTKPLHPSSLACAACGPRPGFSSVPPLHLLRLFVHLPIGSPLF